MTPNLRPRGPWVLVEVLPPAKESPEGIVMPDDNVFTNIGYTEAVVVRPGDGKQNTKRAEPKFLGSDLEEGQVVVLRRHLSVLNPISDDGKYVLIHEDDIIGEVKEGHKLTPCVPYDN